MIGGSQRATVSIGGRPGRTQVNGETRFGDLDAVRHAAKPLRRMRAHVRALDQIDRGVRSSTKQIQRDCFVVSGGLLNIASSTVNDQSRLADATEIWNARGSSAVYAVPSPGPFSSTGS